MPVYIQNISQISVQKPLDNEWFTNPIYLSSANNESQDPDYRKLLPAAMLRRAGLLIKRAITTAVDVMQKSNLSQVEGIVIGTGLGCLEHTEKFLKTMIENEEKCLQPTAFMQSTHNTIASQIALFIKCHGYNCTYSHRGISFESALLDAFLQITSQNKQHIIVGAHDEMTSDLFSILDISGNWKKGEISIESLKKAHTKGTIYGSASVNMLVTAQKNADTLCCIEGIRMMYKPNNDVFVENLQSILSNANITMNEIDAVVMGINGDKVCDEIYQEKINNFFADRTTLWYKHVFGESFSASVFGVMLSAFVLKNNVIPQGFVYHSNNQNSTKPLKYILVYNQFQNLDHSLTLLSCLD